MFIDQKCHIILKSTVKSIFEVIFILRASTVSLSAALLSLMEKGKKCVTLCCSVQVNKCHFVSFKALWGKQAVFRPNGFNIRALELFSSV